jgi:hypothetical protein
MFMLLAILVMLSSAAFAGARPPPTDLPEGPFTTPGRAVALNRARAALIIVPDALTDGAVLEYVWEEFVEGEWRAWTSGRIVGGRHRDKNTGLPLTEFTTLTPPRAPGSRQVRLRGTVRGQAIRVAPDVEEAD